MPVTSGIKAAARLIVLAVLAFRRNRMMVHAEALAFRILLSMFPFILFSLALLVSLQRPEFFDWLVRHARIVLPPAVLDLVEQAIGELRAPQAGLLSAGAIVALWLASGAVRSLMSALNLVFGAVESRPFWTRYPVSILFTLGLAMMLVAAALLLSVGPNAMRSLAPELSLTEGFVALWSWVRLPAALALLSLAVATAYHVLPNVEHGFRLFSPGAWLAVLIWFCASFAITAYAHVFTNYSVMYGSTGAVIVLLLFLHLSTAALLLGAEVNAVIEQRQRKTLP
ncbi:YihY/virulence factor BrkB family protein [Massilia scottii]|uniref:YihY/virulence factor BrkB family protein n=1 Tax=Massilia scottii TaxID=3057166 RepID=UPI0027965E83|nr:YihY/virulence factor BrkB family protein [Massilia sp. CCM 9029]MDQ1833725.1 YihY/virulence factor BrkB family protein [Massilia sp. CCM 9029]